MSWTKLHGSIIHSSIWQEDSDTRVLWITMLAMADSTGTVYGSVRGLANAARIPEDVCRKALELFQGPDPDSSDRTDGRRIERVDGGWYLLNHQSYREKQTPAQQKAAERQRRYRERKRRSLNGVTSNVAPSTNGSVNGNGASPVTSRNVTKRNGASQHSRPEVGSVSASASSSESSSSRFSTLDFWIPGTWIQEESEEVVSGGTGTLEDELEPIRAKITPEEREARAAERDRLKEDFKKFWNYYDRKTGRKRCLEWWLRHAPSEELTKQILDSAARYHAACVKSGTPQKYPLTWLHGECWEDEYLPDPDDQRRKR